LAIKIIVVEQYQIGIPMLEQEIIEVDEEEGHVFQLDLVEECEEVFKLNLVDSREKSQDLAQDLVDKHEDNQYPIIIMCEEALIETLFEVVKTFHVLKILFKEVSQNVKNDSILT
jgi:hypothetical protein